MARKAGPPRKKMLAHLNLDQAVALEVLSKRTGMPMTEILRRAVDMYLAAQNPGSSTSTAADKRVRFEFEES
jgi:hypothetical protein